MNDYEKLLEEYGIKRIELEQVPKGKTGLERFLGIDILR